MTFRYAFKGARMSAVDLADPAYQMVPYTRYYHAATLLKAEPAPGPDGGPRRRRLPPAVRPGAPRSPAWSRSRSIR